MRPASALSLNQDSHEARAEEDEQGNVHVNESGGRGLGREHGRGERSIDNILSRVTFLCLRVQHHHRHQNPPRLIINFVIIIA